MTTGKRLLGKVAQTSVLIKGIAHPVRIAIVYLLAEEPLWMKHIVVALNMPESLVAHHLKSLIVSGWVAKAREGRYVTYTLNKKAFRQLPKLLADTPFWKEITS
jgi:DNA-binding transcriptional ArsR family regulator